MNIGRVLSLSALLCCSVIAARADDQRWYVTEDLTTHTCYRVNAPTDQKDWRTLGDFDTFREAGAWVWAHRDVCENSAVFS